MALIDALFVALIVGIATSVAVRFLLIWLRKKSILDKPNDRSSHDVPTPRGGGIAVIVPIIVSLLVLGSSDLSAVILAALALAVISWIDDLRPTHAGIRLAAHIVCVSAVLSLLPVHTEAIAAGVPTIVVVLGVALGWVWFTNLYNFMDGIDGITSVETISICIGITALSFIVPISSDLQLFAIVVTGATVGFAIWNWHPAKVFLGDVGSVPLGFLLGWMLIQLAEEGHLAAALILPAYYVADATVTLLRRGLKRERIWKAHRSHFYQRAVQNGKSHSNVALRILGINCLLVAYAITATLGYPWLSLGAAVVSVALFLGHLAPFREAP